MPELRGEDWIERHEAVVGAQQEPSSEAVIAVLPGATGTSKLEVQAVMLAGR